MPVQQKGKVACHQHTGNLARPGKRIGQSVTYLWGERAWGGLGDDLGGGLGVRRRAAGVSEVVDGFPESGVLVAAQPEQEGERDQGLCGLA
jgi:hypothetical protein